ncbi:MAG: hypothetical protein IJU93_09620 [Lachnospiraceae bacterium]|nr:hypothetical protein [Lachnospiraceae bacterium]
MAINPLMVNGSIMNSQDISLYRMNDDSRAAVVQSHVVEETNQESTEQSTRVNEFANTAEGGEGFDAKNSSGNEYAGDGGAYRRRKLHDKDGDVFIKTKSTTSFNASI